MEIKTYQSSRTPPTQLINLLQRRYGDSKNFDYFISDFEKAFEFCGDNENVDFLPIAAGDGHKMEAHIALILEKRLPAGEAFFGFLETPQDATAFKLVWNSLIKEARRKNISVLKGPINGSIWHQYRCIKETDGSGFFKSELFCEPYYYDFLNANRPNSEIIYYSGYREGFDAILKVLQPAYDKLIPDSFVIKEIEDIPADKLQTLGSLSRSVFQNSWGFTELNQKEFLNLYSSEKLDSHLDKIYLLYKDDQVIGFLGTLKEDSSTLICKTICLLPEYQGMGLGNALAFKVHFDAKKEGIKKMIYALIREDNKVKNFPKDDVTIFRKYAAFEFQI